MVVCLYWVALQRLIVRLQFMLDVFGISGIKAVRAYLMRRTEGIMQLLRRCMEESCKDADKGVWREIMEQPSTDGYNCTYTC